MKDFDLNLKRSEKNRRELSYDYELTEESSDLPKLEDSTTEDESDITSKMPIEIRLASFQYNPAYFQLPALFP